MGTTHEPANGLGHGLAGSVAVADDDVIAATVQWLERAVIGLNLCPFARAVHVKKQVRFVVSAATTPEALLADVQRELGLLAATAAERIDTTLLVHPGVLGSFLDYNDFLRDVDRLLADTDWQADFQVASLHPQYQFAGTQPDDIENFTNRSPYPTLHLLRESSVSKAVAAFPAAGAIFDKNIATLRSLGRDGWVALGLLP